VDPKGNALKFDKKEIRLNHQILTKNLFYITIINGFEREFGLPRLSSIKISKVCTPLFFIVHSELILLVFPGVILMVDHDKC
jgi:hypothetical protein